MNELIYEGKSKAVFTGEDGKSVIIKYKDTATAFNGEKKAELDGKGRINAEISNIIFSHLEENGIETHRIRVLDETTLLAKRAEIILVETIVRNVAAGSFSKRYGVPEGSPLNNTVVEFCYKSDEYGDPLINDSQITAIGLATADELGQMTETTLRINALMTELFRKAGIILVDFKVEYGRFDGGIILCDEISPDSCRLWSMESGEKLDKDRFRRDLGDVLAGYRDVLERIKNV